MAFFPLEPVYARAVVASKDLGCTLEIIDIVSVLSATSKLFVDVTEQREAASDARRMFRHPSGDHLTVLNVVRSYTEIAATEGKSARKAWCRKHFLNERTLLEAVSIREQLGQTCRRMGIDWKVSCGDFEEPVVKSLAHGLAQNSAFLQPDGSYKQTMGQSVGISSWSWMIFLNSSFFFSIFFFKIVKIHPGSVLCDKKVPAIVYDELVR